MRKFTRREIILSTTALAAASISKANDQPIRIIVGFPPGGTTDIISRLIANDLGQILGRSVLVENRPGASGNIAAQSIINSPSDGSYLLFVPSSHSTNPSLYKKLTFNAETDFQAIGMVASTPYVLVVHPSLPVKSVEELISLLKASPNHYQYATASQGTGQHLAAELFCKMANVKMTQIPYKGSSAALPDLISGRTPIMFDNVALMIPHIRKGTLRPLAITSKNRSALLPEVPTVAETIASYETLGWFALMANSKTPQALVESYNTALNKVVSSNNFINRVSELGAEPMKSSTKEASDFIQKEIVRWRQVIDSINITLD